MSVKEVAGLFGTSVYTIYRMVQRNQIPHMVLGGSLRFDPSVLELWLIHKHPELAAAARKFAHAA
jgi:excisionase family DNA binding protein